MNDPTLRPGIVGEVRDGFTLREAEWRNGRLHQIWFNAETGRIRHERLDPPEDIAARARALEALRDNRKERVRKADGLVLAASFTATERDKLHQMGIRTGDFEGIEWALKRDEFRHARVLKSDLSRG